MSEGPPKSDPWAELAGLSQGQLVEIRSSDGRVWTGTLLPSHELSGERIARLKLDSGYNVGIRIEPGDTVRALALAPPIVEPAPPASDRDSGARIPTRPWISLLSTGGTIASRVDYRTGGVRPVRSEREVKAFFPDLEQDGPVRFVTVSDRLSEEVAPADWEELARQVVRAFSDGAQGVVVAHGTDTLAYTSAALAFLLDGLPGPVVLVGAQRSPDRPSSDAFSNMLEAVRLARRPGLSEVVVLMHEGPSDDRFAVHRGTRVRKTHASRRDAFRTRDGPPLGVIEGGELRWNGTLRPRATGPVRIRGPLDARAAILWFHPGLAPDRAEGFARGLRGVVLAGTGLGHVSLSHRPWIEAATRAGCVVVMTTQCLGGSADPFVYATGRELLRSGVTYARDLYPETAYAKLLWALGSSDDPEVVRARMLSDLAGEFEARHPLAELS